MAFAVALLATSCSQDELLDDSTYSLPYKTNVMTIC